MKLSVFPGQPLRGTLRLPGDKSLSHRAALFAALAQGESIFENFLNAGVTRAMLEALTDLGIAWQMDGQTLRVEGRGLSGFAAPAQALNCGNSATTLRLLAGALAGSGIPSILDGSPGLRRRPMRRIVEPLQQMGVPVEAGAGFTAPLHLAHRPSSRRLTGMRHELSIASAQVKSCLLLAGLGGNAPTEVVEPAASRDHSERMLRLMGASVQNTPLPTPGMDGTPKSLTRIAPGDCDLQPLQLSLPGDISAAAFFIVAALITPGSDILIEHVLLNPGRTGMLDVLLSMGADIQVEMDAANEWEPSGNLRVRYSELHGQNVSGDTVVRMIDEFPAFAVAAAYAEGITQVRDARELRAKESDRIHALEELARLGASIDEQADGFDVGGQAVLTGGLANAQGDHRMAMALAVAGLAARNPVTVEGAEIISESLPVFSAALQELGAQVVIST